MWNLTVLARNLHKLIWQAFHKTLLCWYAHRKKSKKLSYTTQNVLRILQYQVWSKSPFCFEELWRVYLYPWKVCCGRSEFWGETDKKWRSHIWILFQSSALLAFVQLSFARHPAPLQGCSQWVRLQVCTLIWDCPNPGTTPCTWPCWYSFCSCGPTSQAEGTEQVLRQLSCTFSSYLLKCICVIVFN